MIAPARFCTGGTAKMTSTLYQMTFMLGMMFMFRDVSGALVGDAPNDAYAKWMDERGAAFTHYKLLSKSGATMSPDDAALSETNSDETLIALHWKINQDDDKIHMAVAVEANGWVGVGFTEMQGMPGADMVIFEGATNKLYDAYSVAYEHPKVDPQQDWTLIKSVTDDGVLIFEAERALDTGDNMDRPIVDDSDLVEAGTRIVAAWGDTDEMTFHGADDRLQASVRFFADPEAFSDRAYFDNAMAEEAEGFITMRMNDIPITGTLFRGVRLGWQYSSKCHSVAELIEHQGLPNDRPVHLIGFDFDPGPYVHHVVVHKDARENLMCDSGWFGVPSSSLHTWDKGQPTTFFYPKEFGLLLADESERAGSLGEPPKTFRLEVHYENPKHLRNLKDHTSVRLYYTTKLRENTGDLMELADTLVKKLGERVGDGLRTHTFTCPSSCTQKHLPPQGVTVFYELYHMHMKGLTMEIVHQRDGEELNKHSVEYFDGHSGGQILRQNYKVLPGDTFETRCTYDSDYKLQFGTSVGMEMCYGQILFYPAPTHIYCTIKSDDKECVSNHTAITLPGKELLARTFGVESPTGVASPALSAKNSKENEEDEMKEQAARTYMHHETTNSKENQGGAVKEQREFIRHATTIIVFFSFGAVLLGIYIYKKRGSQHEGYKKVATATDDEECESGESID